MKRILIVTALCLAFATTAWTADLRQAMESAETALAQRQATDKASRTRISGDRESLTREIRRLAGDIKRLKAQAIDETKRGETLKTRITDLTERRNKLDKEVGRIVAIVRTAAKNLRDLSLASPFSAFTPERLAHLETLADGTQFPGLEDLTSLFAYFTDEIARSSEVAIRTASVTGRDGISRELPILSAGPFMTLAVKEKGTEPLLYDAATLSFKELPAPPGRIFRWRLNRYVQGKTDTLALDLSAGAALDHLRRTPSFVERIQNGGPLVWPIVLIGLAGLFIGLERTLFLKKVHDNTDNTMGKVNELAGYGQWEECDLIVKEQKTTPVYNVLRKGLQARGERRQVLETILQEAILKELPRLERFLPFLGMLGAVAPLLGLLGTVTGMIDTFEVIHIAGTGDPRMMSGGISTALITTMLGLAVAIPIMLLHTVLNRRVEHIIGDMEEKAVALTNIVHRETIGCCAQGCTKQARA
ncbi:MotA/TolQ/ExbB proton channel family protein [Desulfoluna spongiiphila]|uniref:MotA/TolQ/ExbB proton channel family protein n=1 Tax=Desulfoluna spongiiphila TaxID=419481 RepID=UPI00125B233D|nr:MotA/TolQ/ExbB proton channel family protein [Desulfoluna spongiiphila]VVS94527.1 mota/tolq/exbb proton channel [Desulfoluna spongiiphila]